MSKLFLLTIIPLIHFSQNIGDFYQGGIVFYLEGPEKGLIVDTAYLEASYPWSGLDINGNMYDNLVSDWGPYLHYCAGTENESIGTGQLNTTTFVTDHPMGNYAANLCYNSNTSDFTDWFLPSKDELWELMQNIELIDSVINLIGGSPINPNFHWSSTQVIPTGKSTNYAYGAWPYMTNLDTGETFPYLTTQSKNMAYLVRAIRCIDNDCSFNVTSDLNEENKQKKIIKVIDIWGRNTDKKNINSLLIYMYDNGSVEKKYMIK